MKMMRNSAPAAWRGKTWLIIGLVMLSLLAAGGFKIKEYTEEKAALRDQMLAVNIAVQAALWPGLETGDASLQIHDHYITDTVQSLEQFFVSLGYSLENAGNPAFKVPRVFVSNPVAA